MRISVFFVALALSASAWSTGAQMRIIPGDTNEDGCSGRKSAQLCLDQPGVEQCFTLPPDKDYVFGLEPRIERVGKWRNQPLLLFSATFSGCGSGQLTEYALLAESKQGLVNLLPKVELTELSEHHMWDLPNVSSLPVLVTADYVWDFKAGETHFGDHHYRVEAFTFNAGVTLYEKRLSYVTAKRYPSEREGPDVSILATERPAILAGLKSSQR